MRVKTIHNDLMLLVNKEIAEHLEISFTILENSLKIPENTRQHYRQRLKYL